MKKVYIIVFTQLICCLLYSQVNFSSVKKLNERENQKVLINMGIQNMPDIYYAHYYTFPDNIEDMCAFIENHFDYKNDSIKIWEEAVKYLKSNKRKIRIISNNSMFIVYDGKNISYNEKDICATIAMHYPESEYLEKRNDVMFFDSNNRNIREINGSVFVDSIKSAFVKKMRDILVNNNVKFKVSENKRYKFDQYDRILLEYTIMDGLYSFCENESLKICNKKYLEELNNLCKEFCIQYNVNKIRFCTFIVL